MFYRVMVVIKKKKITIIKKLALDMGKIWPQEKFKHNQYSCFGCSALHERQQAEIIFLIIHT